MPQDQASQDETPQDEVAPDDAVSSEHRVGGEPRDDASSTVKRPGRTGSYFKSGKIQRDKGPKVRFVTQRIR